MLLGERQRAYAKSDLDAGKGSLLLCRVDGKQAARLSVPMTGIPPQATKYNGSANITARLEKFFFRARPY